MGSDIEWTDETWNPFVGWADVGGVSGMINKHNKPDNVEDGDIAFRWVTPFSKDEKLFQDIPDEYLVEFPSHCRPDGGCIVHGRYKGEWKTNPTTRALIKHLIEISKGATEL